MRNYGRSDGPGVGTWIAILAGILVLVSAAGLAIYGGSVRPDQQETQQVLANDRFPN